MKKYPHYTLSYTESALRDLAQLTPHVLERIFKKLHFWMQQPDPLHFSKPLSGALSGKYRFRVGDYRIVFIVNKHNEITVVLILAIKHRREIYRV